MVRVFAPGFRVVVGLLGLSAGPALAEEPRPCVRCHADLEFLQQSLPDSQAAHRTWVDPAAFLASPHGDFACVDCHDGYSAFPHRDVSRSVTSCGDCHDDVMDALAASIHADPEVMGQNAGSCISCHGVHDIKPIGADPAPTILDGRCASCHTSNPASERDRHRAAIGCSGCHGSHEIQRLGVPSDNATMTSILQRCGGCHPDQLAAYSSGVHGSAVATWQGELQWTAGTDTPPLCTTCHLPHDVTSVGDFGFGTWMTHRCGQCHAEEAASATDTYHIRARELGSDHAAGCQDCHGAHAIFPSDDPRSSTSEANLLATCRNCHEDASQSFALYQPHPDPRDREKNPYLFFSFWFMNLLLAGVLGVFLLHSAAWWIRIGLDWRRSGEQAEDSK